MRVPVFINSEKAEAVLLDGNKVVELEPGWMRGEPPFADRFMSHGLGGRKLIDIGDKFLDPLPGLLYNFFKIACDAGFHRRDFFVYVGRQPIGTQKG